MADNINRPLKGLHDDNNPINQPEGTYRYALNAVDESGQGDQNSLSAEGAAIPIDHLPDGYQLLGKIYMEDGNVTLFSRNETLRRDEIGIIDKNDKYKTLVNTEVLNFRVYKQIEGIFRVRRGNERYNYWVDGYNGVRSINLDKLYLHYSEDFKQYLSMGGDPNTYVGEKWSSTSFDLIKPYKSVPRFSNIEIIESGAIPSGSYNFAVQYVDDDNNPTEWITVSNIVRVFVDSEGLPYQNIEGSRNVTNNVQTFPPANKSIKITFTGLDREFPYYRVAIIQASSSTGKPTKALVSPPKSTNSPIYIYSGNDDQLAEISLEEIQLDLEAIVAPEHIEQLQNRLLLACSKETTYNWCEFQSYASKVKSSLTTEAVVLNAVDSPPNQKNSNSTFRLRGYMPGDVYSFGIIYLMKDMSYSPVFHIPGRNINETGTRMSYYELANTNYEDIHNCSGQLDYWGKDAIGSNLKNTKVRFHRFPTRKEAGIDLISSTDSTIILHKYRLKYIINLAPGKTYPVDGNNNPLGIPLSIKYVPVGSASPETYSGLLTLSDLGQSVVFYDLDVDVQQAYPPNYFQFDPSSSFWTTYMQPGNETFIIQYYYEPYELETIQNATTSDIYGIEFTNIEKPHRDVIGFFIVRNERLDTDKLVVDNAIFGPNIKTTAFSSFTHINTEFPDTLMDNRAAWFFSPEHQFLNKNPRFNQLQIQGFYTATNLYTPPVEDPLKDKETDEPISGSVPYQGVTVRDVMAGTSYNPEFNKKNSKDTDGFALVVGYRARDYAWSLDRNNTIPTLTGLSDIYYLGATANKPTNGITYYNVSCDNKIGMLRFNQNINQSFWFCESSPYIQKVYGEYRDNLVVTAYTNSKKRLVYATMLNNNTTAYSDFLTRPYYKEHSNPILFGNNIELYNQSIFNGDAQISPINFVTTMYRGMAFAARQKKSSIWKIIAGAVLVVAGVVVGIFTAGAGLGISAAGIALAGAALAVSYGVSLAVSGIKFEQMKNMIENDYSRGLQASVEDWEVQGQLLPLTSGNITSIGDDSLQWFGDRANNLWIESTIPFGLRAGITAGITDFINAPNQYQDEEFRSYLVDKLTVLDRDHNDGRLYKGYPSAEFYDINPDYMRFNKEKAYIHLPEQYDCCGIPQEYQPGLGPEPEGRSNPSRIHYSQQSFQEELTDNYRVFLPNNYKDIEGEHGKITDMYKIGDTLFIHVAESIYRLPANIQERVTDEIVSFIGTGEFFNVPASKVLDDSNGSAGTQDKWATVKTDNGVFFISERDRIPYLHTDSIKNISNGRSNWFQNNTSLNLNDQFFRLTGKQFPNRSNPANKNGIGFHAVHDQRHNRILLTKKDYQLRKEKEAEFAGMFPGLIAAPLDRLYYDEQYRVFGIKTRVPGPALLFRLNIIDLDNTEYFVNRSWTYSFSLHTGMWKSEHSYLPNFYIAGKNVFYTTRNRDEAIYKHNTIGKYLNFYNIKYPFIVELVSNNDPTQTKIWNDITINTVAKRYDTINQDFVIDRDITFNKGIFYNNRQSSGLQNIISKDINSDPLNYLSQQISDIANQIMADKVEENWNINNLRDFRIDYTKPIFKSDPLSLQATYPIDKILDESTIDYNKDWSQLESFRDKYLIIRLIFDTFEDINLVLNYLIDSSQNSER